MRRFATLLGTGLLAVATMLQAGCSGNGVGMGILTGSNPAPAAQAGVFLPDITGRPEQVAFTSACALAYGFTHDPVKLRTAYIAFESKRGVAREQLSNIEKAYDTTYQAIDVLTGSRKSSFCATKDGEEVRSELRRYTSGFFEARTPTPVAASADWKKTRVDPDCGGRC